MDVQVQRTFTTPPPPSGPPCSEVQPTIFDLVAPPYHVTVLFAYAPPNPTNTTLLHALIATIPRFPLLTARRILDHHTNRPLFLTGSEGNAGALVVEATVSSPLSDHLPLTPSPDLERLHPPVDKATPHVLVLQLNRFACGGLVIASSAHHQAADGYSMSLFLHAWADAVRFGAAPPLDYLSNHDIDVVPYGPSAIAPRRPPRCEFEHRGVEFLPLDAAPRPVPARVHPSEITNLMLHYTAKHVAELKAQAQDRYTTFETLAAHLWRKITVARSRAGDDDYRTALNVTVNGRARLGTDSIPKGLFGNAVLTASSGKASARAVVEEGTLADAAAMVRAGVRARDRRYFQSFIDFGELHGDEEMEPMVGDEDNVLLPDVAVDSWLHLELHRLDFGCGGRLVGILPAHSPLDGVVVLIPSLRKEGGVDVFVALWDKHAEVVRDIAYTMK
ncbi:hypothetical protein HU200_049894 [Digitaria exilis]|uniref:Uncharacterized protein n=1 Tax=Digitaria exilis TaxID=1010633 RepID=A0A835E817_9POAL|nr:hypothetical protein HU200_049894 [Digitaria exilis]CAB3489011.1 unnamed protein product [Digitaria exilis]